MIVKKFPIRNTFFFHAFICCLLLAPSIAGAAIEDHITRTESGFYYTVQKGDTLWDLSRHFSNSPWVWPELWSHNNPKILNPNLIYPGQKILIYKKDWEGTEKMAQPSAPAPTPAPAPSPIEETENFQGDINLDRVGYIRKTATPHHGTIFKSQHDLALIDAGRTVYIHPAPGAPAFNVGEKYTVFRTFDHIKHPETKKDIGVQHLLTGVVEITSVEPDFATGNIIASFRSIEINDLLMPYTKRDDLNISLRKGIEGLSSRIIKPEDDDILIGERKILFIDKGKNDGVEPGQVYSIFLEESVRPNPEKFKEVDLFIEIGSLIVLHTEPTTSTVWVINSKEQITAGNLVKTLAAKTP
ncbi:MAG: LysM domain-containing protein [Desulfobacteraceae bacterium]|nr:MAG: LysM domain-containing protein [Desulfobacteraceae bacterium]